MAAYCELELDYSLVGTMVGKWTRIGPSFLARKWGTQRARFVVCQCKCGAVRVVSDASCKSGGTGGCKSCCGRGKHTIHGQTDSVEYRLWQGMIRRCHYERDVSFPNYGAKGIRVCDQWRGPGGFEAFFSHLGRRPTPKHQVDRVRSSGNYEPGNVRWATTVEQARNRSNNTILVHNGRSNCLAGWADEYGIKRDTLQKRLQRGWTMEAALTSPLKKNLYG
jgi:hypothetical protein